MHQVLYDTISEAIFSQTLNCCCLRTPKSGFHKAIRGPLPQILGEERPPCLGLVLAGMIEHPPQMADGARVRAPSTCSETPFSVTRRLNDSRVLLLKMETWKADIKVAVWHWKIHDSLCSYDYRCFLFIHLCFSLLGTYLCQGFQLWSAGWIKIFNSTRMFTYMQEF